MGQRRLEVVADLLVELLVLLVGDVFFGAGPDGVGLVHRLPVTGFDHAAGLAAAVLVARVDQLAVLPLFFFHQDRQADVVRVLADDALDLPGAGVIQRVVAQVQRHAGAACGAVDGFDLEVTGASADPAHPVGGAQAGAT